MLAVGISRHVGDLATDSGEFGDATHLREFFQVVVADCHFNTSMIGGVHVSAS